MTNHILTKIGLIVGTFLIGLMGILGIVDNRIDKKCANLGTTVPKVVAVFETSLASKITKTATSMTLVNGTDNAGNPLSGYMCFVIDEGSANEEFVCGNASSTSVTGMKRGIDPVNPGTEVDSLKHSHRRGASVKVTDYPQLGILTRIINGDDTFPNIISYETSSLSFTDDAQIITKKYADDLTYSGAPDASETVKGIVEQATLSELGSGVSSGDTTAPLFVPNQYFSKSSSATTIVPVTGSDGKLSSGFIDQTADYNWSGTHTFSGNNTFSGDNTFSGTATISHMFFDEKGFYDFGNGSDGDITISSNTTLTRDMYYNNLTVN
ncbi:MAG: hypothetical protein DRH57_08325, partial [Candidatus Cloacimonadota bacterium]